MAWRYFLAVLFFRRSYCCCFHFWFCAACWNYTKAVCVFFRTERRRSFHFGVQRHSYQWVVCIYAWANLYIFSDFPFYILRCTLVRQSEIQQVRGSQRHRRSFYSTKSIHSLFINRKLFEILFIEALSGWQNNIPRILCCAPSIRLHFSINCPIHFVRNRFQNQSR